MEEKKSDGDSNMNAMVKPKLTFKENKCLFIKTQLASFGRMIWNNKKRQLLLKDGEDWFNVSLFYVIFYAIIGAYTWSMMAVFMAINKNGHPIRPKYAGTDGVLSNTIFSPGMGVRPHIGNGLSAISFSVSNPSFYKNYFDVFLAPYNNSRNSSNVVACNSSQTSAPTNQACLYDVNSYLNQLNCNSSNNYGYSSTPCVFVKLNNVFDWIPQEVKLPSISRLASNPACVNFTNSDINPQNDSFIFVTCNGMSESDKNNVNFTYASPLTGAQTSPCVAGIPFYYYPYENVANYMQPIIPVKLKTPRGVQVNIECYASAVNVMQDNIKGYGYVQFSIQVND